MLLQDLEHQFPPRDLHLPGPQDLLLSHSSLLRALGGSMNLGNSFNLGGPSVDMFNNSSLLPSFAPCVAGLCVLSNLLNVLGCLTMLQPSQRPLTG